MKNYSVIYKTNTGKIVEYETNLLDLAYLIAQEVVEDGDFDWLEIEDHANADIIEYLESKKNNNGYLRELIRKDIEK